MSDQNTAPGKKVSSFSIDVLKLASGTTIAQALNVLAAPVLARLYSPDAFGVLALFTSLTGIIAVIICLRYELTILLPDRDEDAANLVAGSLIISALVSLATIPFVWWLGPSIGLWLKSPDFVPFLWLLPPAVFFGGIGAGHPVLNAWASRKRNFNQITITRLVSSIARVGATLAAGLAGFNSAGGLILGGLVGSVLSPVWLGWQIWWQDRRFFLANIRWPKIWVGLKRYRKFPIYNVPAGLLNTISWQIPSFMLSTFFSTTVVGYYAMGNLLLRVPMDLVGASIGEAFYAHAATAYQEGTLSVFVENTFRRLVEYSFFPILLLTVIGKELFLIVFGPEWIEAGVYTQILSLWMMFWFISSPMSRLYSVLEKNEFAFGLNVVILLTRMGSIWLGGIMKSPYLSLLFFSISGAVVYGYLSVSIVRLAGTSWFRIGRILINNIFISSCAMLAILILKIFDFYAIYQLAVAVFLVLAYYLYRFKTSWPIRLTGV